jgi:hypothetical protein
MTQYYFLSTILPPLELGLPPELNFDEFLTLLEDNLTSKDKAKADLIRSLYDIYNLRALWKGEPPDHWGNLDRNALEEAVLTNEGSLPNYVFDFLKTYEHLDERLKYFPLLLATYFEETFKTNKGFLRVYAQFERNLRLTLMAYRAKQLGRDLSIELQMHNPEENIIAQLLAQKTAKTFEPPTGFEELKSILNENVSPFALQKTLLEYRFNKLEEFVGLDIFSIDWILLYLVEYIIIDKWMKLDKKMGIEMVDTLVKEAT